MIYTCILCRHFRLVELRADVLLLNGRIVEPLRVILRPPGGSSKENTSML